MNILSSTPFNTAFTKIACCLCGKEMKLNDIISYEITKSGLFVCQDCIDDLVIKHCKTQYFHVP